MFELLHRFRDKYRAWCWSRRKRYGGADDRDEQGALDAAFIRLPCERSEEFSYKVLDIEEMMVALPKKHPLSQGKEVRLAALRHDTLITFPRDLSAGAL